MSSSPLHPDILLGIRLSAICARNEYTTDPAPVIEELLSTAGDRTDILAQEAGVWSGFNENDEFRRVLAVALWEIPGVARWVPLGRERRVAGRHAAN